MIRNSGNACFFSPESAQVKLNHNMDYRNQPELLATLRKFLRQRKKALQVLKGSYRTAIKPDLAATEVTAGMLLRQLDMRQRYTYWGLCRFVLEYRRQLEACLPSQGAGHKTIRASMEQLIAYCCEQAFKDKASVDGQHIS